MSFIQKRVINGVLGTIYRYGEDPVVNRLLDALIADSIRNPQIYEKSSPRPDHRKRSGRVRNKKIQGNDINDDDYYDSFSDDDVMPRQKSSTGITPSEKLERENEKVTEKYTTLRKGVFETALQTLPCMSDMFCISCSTKSATYSCIDCKRVPVYYCKSCVEQKCNFLHRVFDVEKRAHASESIWKRKLMVMASCIYCGNTKSNTPLQETRTVNVVTSSNKVDDVIVQGIKCAECKNTSGMNALHHGFYEVENTWICRKFMRRINNIRLEGSADVTDRAVTRTVLTNTKSYKNGRYVFRTGFRSNGGRLCSEIGLGLQLDMHIKSRMMTCNTRTELSREKQFSCSACAKYGCRAHMDGMPLPHLVYLFILILSPH